MGNCKSSTIKEVKNPSFPQNTASMMIQKFPSVETTPAKAAMGIGIPNIVTTVCALEMFGIAKDVTVWINSIRTKKLIGALLLASKLSSVFCKRRFFVGFEVPCIISKPPNRGLFFSPIAILSRRYSSVLGAFCFPWDCPRISKLLYALNQSVGAHFLYSSLRQIP